MIAVLPHRPHSQGQSSSLLNVERASSRLQSSGVSREMAFPVRRPNLWWVGRDHASYLRMVFRQPRRPVGFELQIFLPAVCGSR